ncbi:hypothetical protein [Streptomyces sp. NBC_01565]|uniref:hypothetical protein n=1 Tax=unclassified Streptomyces TaxID=2593676 RepID=UPI00224E3591|nr:hypothetical protein [Streptomyces sp. NBC_01565]MCX4546522.1 hypothetical protein [Streptomyces sp. NBC_01565]
MTGDYDHQIRDLDHRIDSLESDLSSLSGKFGDTDDLDYELRDIRSDVSSAESKLEELETELNDHVGETDRAMKQLVGQVRLLEGQLLAAGGAQRADLDSFTAEQRKLARAVSLGWEARNALLGDYERSAHRQRVQRFGASTVQHQEHRAEVIAAVGKLVATGAARDRAAAVTELGQALGQERRFSQDLERQAGPAAEAKRALAADAKVRAEKQSVIVAGEKAEQKLTLAFRSRLTDAVSARALPPVWFATVLGSVPPASRTQKWVETATGLLLYRLVYGITDSVVALGDKPDGRTGRRAEWYKQLAQDLRYW